MREFVPNPNFGDEVMADDETRAGLAKFAEDEIAPRADALARSVSAPWMPRPGEQLIQVEDDGENVWLANTDYAAHLYEYGSAKSEVAAPLRRAVLEAGGSVDEDPGL